MQFALLLWKIGPWMFFCYLQLMNLSCFFFQLSDHLGSCGTDCTPTQSFISLQKSLFLTCFVSVLGGGLFLWSALFLKSDRDKARKETQGKEMILKAENTVIYNQGRIYSCLTYDSTFNTMVLVSAVKCQILCI